MIPKSILGAVQALAALASGKKAFGHEYRRARDAQPRWVHAARIEAAKKKRARKGMRRASERNRRVEYHGKPTGFVGRHW